MSLKFRQALEAAPLAHLQRLAGKIPGSLRNTDPSSRETSLALAARCGRLDVFEWLLLDEAHDEGEISRDARGETILHAAAGRGSSDIIALYLGQYPYARSPNSARLTAQIRAGLGQRVRGDAAAPRSDEGTD